MRVYWGSNPAVEERRDATTVKDISVSVVADKDPAMVSILRTATIPEDASYLTVLAMVCLLS